MYADQSATPGARHEVRGPGCVEPPSAQALRRLLPEVRVVELRGLEHVMAGDEGIDGPLALL
jgi:hypothetical protein